MQTYPKLEAKHAGCWFDGARGIYIGEAVIKEALAAGWSAEGYTEEEFKVHGEGVDPEAYQWATDAAEEFLASLAPDGFWIGSNENGDFGMWQIEAETA